MNRVLLLSVLVFAVGLRAFGDGASPPRARAERAGGPITLDGELSEDAWQGVAAQSEFNLLGSRKTPAQRTEFRTLYDDEALYLGIFCAEEEMDKLGTRGRERDSGLICSDDSVELFLAPGNGYYYQFVVNVIGYMYDGRYEAREGLTPPEMLEGLLWDGAWEAIVHQGEDFWSAEFRIPFATLDMSGGCDEEWLLNVARTESRRGYACWSPVKAGYHDLSRFGILSGHKPPERVASPDVSRLDFPVFYVGDNRLDLNVPVEGGAGRAFALRTSVREWGPGLLDERVLRQSGIRATGGMLPLRFDVPVSVPRLMQELVVEISDEETGRPLALKMHLFRAPAPLESGLPPTVVFDDDGAVEVAAGVRLAGEDSRGRLEMRVSRAGSKRSLYRRGKKIRGSGVYDMRIPARKLAEDGEYVVSFVLTLSDGSEFRDEVSFFKLSGDGA